MLKIGEVGTKSLPLLSALPSMILEKSKLMQKKSVKNIDIAIFCSRIIIGPDRLGILKKLSALIDLHLVVPIIGNEKNCYQMISIFDCVSAILCAIQKSVQMKNII